MATAFDAVTWLPWPIAVPASAVTLLPAPTVVALDVVPPIWAFSPTVVFVVVVFAAREVLGAAPVAGVMANELTWVSKFPTRPFNALTAPSNAPNAALTLE